MANASAISANPAAIQRSIPAEQRDFGKKFFPLYAVCFSYTSFLDIEPSSEQWPNILEYTSFPWMKQHEEKFEARTAGKVPILKTGAMIRQGQIGKAKGDGMTDEISQHLRQSAGNFCQDPTAIKWFYEGGVLP